MYHNLHVYYIYVLFFFKYYFYNNTRGFLSCKLIMEIEALNVNLVIARTRYDIFSCTQEIRGTAYCLVVPRSKIIRIFIALITHSCHHASLSSSLFVPSHAFYAAPLPLFYIHSLSRLSSVRLYFTFLSYTQLRGEARRQRALCVSLSIAPTYFLSRR